MTNRISTKLVVRVLGSLVGILGLYLLVCVPATFRHQAMWVTVMTLSLAFLFLAAGWLSVSRYSALAIRLVSLSVGILASSGLIAAIKLLSPSPSIEGFLALLSLGLCVWLAFRASKWVEVREFAGVWSPRGTSVLGSAPAPTFADKSFKMMWQSLVLAFVIGAASQAVPAGYSEITALLALCAGIALLAGIVSAFACVVVYVAGRVGRR